MRKKVKSKVVSLRVAAAQMRFAATIEGNLERIEKLAGEAAREHRGGDAQLADSYGRVCFARPALAAVPDVALAEDGRPGTLPRR